MALPAPRGWPGSAAGSAGEQAQGPRGRRLAQRAPACPVRTGTWQAQHLRGNWGIAGPAGPGALPCGGVACPQDGGRAHKAGLWAPGALRDFRPCSTRGGGSVQGWAPRAAAADAWAADEAGAQPPLDTQAASGSAGRGPSSALLLPGPRGGAHDPVAQRDWRWGQALPGLWGPGVPLLAALEALGVLLALACQCWLALSLRALSLRGTALGATGASAAAAGAAGAGPPLFPAQAYHSAMAALGWQNAALLLVLLLVCVSRLLMARSQGAASRGQGAQGALVLSGVQGGGGDVAWQVRAVEGDLGVTVGMLRALSRHVEKLGVQFRVTRRTLRDAANQASESVALQAQQVSLLQQSVLAQQRSLEELQLILVGLQDQCVRQFHLFSQALRKVQGESTRKKRSPTDAAPRPRRTHGAAGEHGESSPANGAHAPTWAPEAHGAGARPGLSSAGAQRGAPLAQPGRASSGQEDSLPEPQFSRQKDFWA